MTIVEFLLARILEDEVRATMRGWHAEDCDTVPRGEEQYTYPCDCGVPERLLRECEAKRRIVAWFGPVNESDDRETYDRVLSALAAVYADHPEYDPEWATA